MFGPDVSRAGAMVVNALEIAVLKVGGSVLTDAAAYGRVGAFIAHRLAEEPQTKIVVVVSAEHGVTDALMEMALGISSAPDPAMVDLLWSTGELRAVALLALSLQSLGVRATGINVHQTGLTQPVDRIHDSRPGPGGPGDVLIRPLRILTQLAAHQVVVVPGFLARGTGDAVVSLGRGGSDLTAVLVAAGLNARCELIKDVAGYFSADPTRHPGASHLPAINYEIAMAMADEGCPLVQRAALEAAQQHGVPVVVRSMAGKRQTRITANVFHG